MNGPDFLIIGAMKCGTTTLQAQLALQEGVFMTTPKEPNFFSDDDVYARGLDWYSRFLMALPPDISGGRLRRITPSCPRIPTRSAAWRAF